MVSKFEQERDRRGMLSDYLYGVSKLYVSGVGIGGLSPLITGQEMGLNNYVCVIMGSLAAYGFAYCANIILKYRIKS